MRPEIAAVYNTAEFPSTLPADKFERLLERLMAEHPDTRLALAAYHLAPIAWPVADVRAVLLWLERASEEDIYNDLVDFVTRFKHDGRPRGYGMYKNQTKDVNA